MCAFARVHIQIGDSRKAARQPGMRKKVRSQEDVGSDDIRMGVVFLLLKLLCADFWTYLVLLINDMRR